jgi:hypothetical protein
MAVLHWLWATTLLSAIASSGAVVYDSASTLQNAVCGSEAPVSVATYTARHQARLEADVASSVNSLGQH